MSSKISQKKDAALLTLLAGGTQEEAGEASGVKARTVRRWLQDGAFVNQLDELRRIRLAQMLNKVGVAQHQAVEALADIVSDPDQSGTTRVSAAKVLIEPALNFTRGSPVTEFLHWARGAAGEEVG